MRRLYLLDSWFLIARLDRLDRHHKQAERLAAHAARMTWLTHDAILSEVLAYFSAQGAILRTKAAEAARFTLTDIEVIATSGPVFARALDLYEQRPDKEYSLVDCMSMVVMRDRGIEHVLTNDHHFRQEGFTVLSDAP